jgi:hypothetical protein
MVIVLAMLTAGESFAQISPGPLHRSHADLEGVQNCTKCHGTNRELVAEKCLACHGAIKARLDSRTGLHGKQSYAQCQNCHVEHQGGDFALIYWKNGQKSLDHALTGYTLDGKHSGLECRTCHTAKFIADSTAIVAEKINKDSTFLGLSAVCSTCHTDEHRGQLTVACSTCHTTAGWKPATGFDHARTKFALTGKHLPVLCAKCHVEVADRGSPDDTSFAKLTGLRFQQCTDCHTDVHKGKLGDNCQNCHSTDGWNVTDKAKFDHTKTKYPLEGRHAVVACDKCHAPGKGRQPFTFAACRACHSDFHKGEFAKRESKGACEECHTVNGYSPAKFLLSQHEQSTYPLRGAHRAVPCDACHRSRQSESQAVIFQFRFKSTRCLDCHTDPHRGEVKKYVEQKGCEYCHAVESWRNISFDHSGTKFSLEGKHRSVDCRKCHSGISRTTGQTILTMAGARFECAACHADVHRGQFAKGEPASTDCSYCHSSDNWKASRFDHNLSARFKLDGAHKNVPCKNCHRPMDRDGEQFIAYKPLDTTCVSCHGGTVPALEEKKS